MQEFVDVLGAPPPFDVLGTEELARLLLCRETDGPAAVDGAHRSDGGPSLEPMVRRMPLPVFQPRHASRDAMTTAAVFLAVAHRPAARAGPSGFTVEDLGRVTSGHRLG